MELNVAELKVNQSIHVRDIKLENVKFLDSETGAVVGVIPPTVEKEATPAVPGEAAAEPEVIAKGKKVEEEGAAPAAGAAPAEKEKK